MSEAGNTVRSTNDVWRVSRARAAEAVAILLEVFPDFPGSNLLDPAEAKRIARLLHERTVDAGLAIGRVDGGAIRRLASLSGCGAQPSVSRNRPGPRERAFASSSREK